MKFITSNLALGLILVVALIRPILSVAQVPSSGTPYPNKVEASGLQVNPPTNFVTESGSNPEVLMIIRPGKGIFPQMNLVRTKIYSRSISGDDWSRIVEEDYKKIGIGDIRILKTRELELKGKDTAPINVPAVDISYSRGSEQIWSTVARISFDDSDLVLTIKSNSSDILKSSGLAHELLNGITIDTKKIKMDQASQANRFISSSAWVLLALILVYFCYRGYKVKTAKTSHQ